MTQKEVDLVFNITITLVQSRWFKEKTRTSEEIQQWVAEQLAINDIFTIPIGGSWAVLTDNKVFNKNV